MVRACTLIASAERAILPGKRRRRRPVARISAGTPAFMSSPAALCGTSTNMRNGSVCAMRYRDVVDEVLPAVTRLPTSILRSVIVPSNGALTSLNSRQRAVLVDSRFVEVTWASAA